MQSRRSLRTTSLNGSFSTIYFGQPFDEKTFALYLYAKLYIYVPEDLHNGSMLFIDIDMDIDTEVNDEIRVLAYKGKASKAVDGSRKKVHLEYRIDDSLNNNM